MIEELIEALQIIAKYAPGLPHPTHCEHDILYLHKPADMSQEDIVRMGRLGFHISEEFECFASFRFGSS